MRSLQLSHWLYKLKPFTLTSEMMWHLECGTDFEVNRKCKNCPILWQMDQKNTGLFLPRRPLVETSIFAICGKAEFFSCGKVIRDNLIFRKLPLDNFPQSAFRKIPAPHLSWCSASCEFISDSWYLLLVVGIVWPICVERAITRPQTNC